MNEAERLTVLEERYAHLARHSAEQDRVMLGLSEEIARLRKEITLLRGQVAGSRGEAEDTTDERPPHY